MRTCLAVVEAMPTGPAGAVLGDLAGLRTALGEHARVLASATTRRWPVASLERGDPHPTRQAMALGYAITGSRELLGPVAEQPDALRHLVVALADTTAALAETADAHLAAGTWLVQTRGTEELRWVRSDTWHDVPEPFQTLRTAAFQVPRLRQLATTDSVDPLRQTVPQRAAAGRQPAKGWADGVPSVRHLLAPAPFQSLRPGLAPGRPAHPSFPPQPMAPPIRRKHQRR